MSRGLSNLETAAVNPQSSHPSFFPFCLPPLRPSIDMHTVIQMRRGPGVAYNPVGKKENHYPKRVMPDVREDIYSTLPG